MKIIPLESDIKLMYVEADSFPDGIMEAHQTLHELVPYTDDRRYFGLSRPENGTIVYKAAAEELWDPEAEVLNFKTIVLKKGAYVSEEIKDFAQDPQSIINTFQELLRQPGLDPEGYCVEWYFNAKDVRCMIRLNMDL